MSEAVQLGWEQLVTDGHVRAARVRRATPYLLTIGVLLILVGWSLLNGIEPAEIENDRDSTLEQEVARQQQMVHDIFVDLPAPQIRRTDLSEVPSAEIVYGLQVELMSDLEALGTFEIENRDEFRVEMIDPSDFWTTRWEARRLYVVDRGSTKLVGLIVNQGDVEYPMLERWLAVFRSFDGRWDVVSIMAPGFVAVPETASVDVREIPVTLRKVMD